MKLVENLHKEVVGSLVAAAPIAVLAQVVSAALKVGDDIGRAFETFNGISVGGSGRLASTAPACPW